MIPLFVASLNDDQNRKEGIGWVVLTSLALVVTFC